MPLSPPEVAAQSQLLSGGQAAEVPSAPVETGRTQPRHWISDTSQAIFEGAGAANGFASGAADTIRRRELAAEVGLGDNSGYS